MSSGAFDVAVLIQRMLQREDQIICVDNEDLGQVLLDIREEGIAVVGKGATPHDAMEDALKNMRREDEMDPAWVNDALFYFLGPSVPLTQIEAAMKLFTEGMSERVALIWGYGKNDRREFRVLVICGN
ncbi:MAG TPA: hypothetical protein PLV42_05520 [bacterium]|nr:hypothetical protein [bacterium]